MADVVTLSVGGQNRIADLVTLGGGMSASSTAAAGSQANPIATLDPGVEYETVAASQTAQVLGSTGAVGDLLTGLLVVPATTSPGAISILDGATSITVFAGGTLTSVIPFAIPLGVKSVSGPWKVTTGANVSVIGVGDFT